MTSAVRSFACALIFCIVFSGVARAQSEEGIPVNDPLVIAKCASCHARDDRGNMQRISFARTTPEAWQDALKRMILGYGVSVNAPEARSIVKYLSTNHGLAPEEAKPVMYDTERRVQEETTLPRGGLGTACTKCHTFARALSWRRSTDDWKQFAASHAAQYKVPNEATATFLAKAAPLHTPEWDAWSARKSAVNLAGRWMVTASILGHGKYFGEMQVVPTGDDEFNTRVTLISVRDGSKLVRSGHIAVYGGYAWRGRSKGENLANGTSPASGAADDLASETREVLWIAPDQSSAEGRWFWGQYQEFGFDVKLTRASSNPTLVAVDRASLKADSQANRIRVVGYNLPTQIGPADLNFGPGLTVRTIVSHTASEVIADVDVASDASLGKHDLALKGSAIPGALAIYDRVDYVKVTPESALATFGDATQPRGYQQFEAIGYQRGADGKLHTADDVDLGPVEVNWSLEVFYVAEGVSTDFVGKVSPTGLLTPASQSPGNNFDVWVVATAKNDKDRNGRPLVGKCYLVVTVPSYTFAGREYVRDLNKWVDNGPVAAAQGATK
ncbi:MAG: quinohemoprotein amine dehydrogenase subunit alpha [Acidobacteriia bacterium]|nr:quinohemoprotein amine dehydrogenase subunit alpha [Terriglobia bacterium]